MEYALTIIVLIVFFSVLLPVYGFWDFGGWESKYNELLAENDELKHEISNMRSEILKITELYEANLAEIKELKSEISILTDEKLQLTEQSRDYRERNKHLQQLNNDQLQAYDELVVEYDAISNAYDRQIRDYNELVDDYNVIDDAYDRQIRDYNELVDDYNVIDDAYDRQIRDYNELIDDYNHVITRPGLEIDKTDVYWYFNDSKGNNYSMMWPVETYEDLKTWSDWKSTNSEPISLNNDGHIIRTINLDGFVIGNHFECCIDEVYDNSGSNADFVWEVWYIVSQLTIYDKDVYATSEGRYALETIVRGGGDCEDLAILIAELLMSSKHTQNWEFQYGYMDSYNPTDPQTVNHVILSVHDGTDNYLIEATGEPSWDYYPDGVVGWWYDV